MGLEHHDRNETAFGLAIGQALRARHPRDTAKRVATDLSSSGGGCTIRTAENIINGHVSARTMTRLVRAYGWDLLIEAGAKVIGRTLREHIIDMQEAARHEQRTWEEREQQLRDLEARLQGAPPMAGDQSRGVPGGSRARGPKRPRRGPATSGLG